MVDMSWLASEAKQIHQIFTGLFFALVTFLLVLGVLIEFFKFPLGGTPAFTVLVGRSLVAAILLISYPEVSNIIADVTDALAKEIGGLRNIDLVLDRMGEKIESLTFSWTSLKESVIFLITSDKD
jgi:hypothetical protein